MVFQVIQNSDRNSLLSSIQNDTSGLAGLSQFQVKLVGDSRAFGSFSSDPFRLRSGVVLSTGRVADLPGINTADGKNTYTGGEVKDSLKDLSTDFGSIGVLGDDIQLRIDFFADDSKDTLYLYFQYVFGSEEFKEYAGQSFKDNFSLSLNGIERAALPNGKQVTINTILNSPIDSGEPYYIDNPVGTGPASDQTRLDGYTIPVLFQAPLKKNAINTLIMRVQDVGDGLYDSAVFIKAGTLGTRRPPDIEGAGTPPFAKDDIYSTNASTPLIIDASRGVLANDTNSTTATLNAALVASPQNGSLVLNPDGSFRYTPNPNFIGTDRFTYKDTTSVGESQPAAVTIEVIRNLIVARDDIYSTNASTPLIIDASRGVLANDTTNTATLNATLVASPQNGSLVLNPDGSFRYTPNPNFIGTDRFTYKDTTSVGESQPAAVTIEVVPNLFVDLIGTPGRDVLVGTNRAERIIGLQGGDTLTGGGGRDQFIYQNINEGGDRITDFTIGEDKIILTGVMQSIGYSGSNPIADGIISFRQASANLATIQIDPDGPNSQKFKPVPFILLDNITISGLSNPDNFVF